MQISRPAFQDRTNGTRRSDPYGASGAARPLLAVAAREVVPLPNRWTPVAERLVEDESTEGVLAEAHILRKCKGEGEGE